VQEVDEHEPWNPPNDHEDQNSGVNPLEVGVVLVDDFASDARSINEAVRG
jgi:hypothetical protein